MSDNAASGDSPEKSVHPSTGPTATATIEETVNENADPQQPDPNNGFDPDTLANLAALSRIAHVEGSDVDADGEDVVEDGQEDDSALLTRRVTREQVQDMVNSLAIREETGIGEQETDKGGDGDEREVAKDREEDEVDREERDGTGDGETDENGSDDESRSGDEEGALRDPRFIFEGGRLKRKRNRTTLMSSTKTCAPYALFPFADFRFSAFSQNNVTGISPAADGNSTFTCESMEAVAVYSVKRGVPGMCRMETPILPQRKKRRPVDDVPINYELGLRVQALESLIRSGSNMDAEAASTAAMETILHATRAANSGSQDANNALAQLTQSGVSSMSQVAQSNLLMDVLQQLSAASSGRPVGRTNGESSSSGAKDIWSSVPAAFADSSLRVASSFEEDDDPGKLNLSIHGFREDNGRIFIPPTVRYAEKSMRNENILAQEALPIQGRADFIDLGVKFAYGADTLAYRNRKISAIQAVSLTGALRLAATFIARFSGNTGARTVYVPSPTTVEDTTALREAGLDVRSFSYLDRKNGGIDFEGVREDLQASPITLQAECCLSSVQAAPTKSAVLLHVSGSMPTGAEFTSTQWRMITAILSLIPLVVMPFQGLSSGDTNRDAQPIRYMIHEGLPVVLVQSFDAMMGLYSDSPALISVVTQSSAAKDRVDSQLRAIARASFLHPSPWGAHVAHTILSDPKLYSAWLAEIKAMSDRLRSVREKLYDVIANKLKTPGTWHHIKRSTGMYCSTLFTASQVQTLASQRHIYLLSEGCFSLGCLNAAKIDTLARAIDYVVREGIREAEEQAAQNIAMELALAAAKEAQAREDAEAAAAAAREEDTLLMERSIASAMEAQKRAEEDDKRREEETRDLEESLRKAAERAEIARQAEAILATIQANG